MCVCAPSITIVTSTSAPRVHWINLALDPISSTVHFTSVYTFCNPALSVSVFIILLNMLVDNMYCSPDSSCKRQKLETNHIVKREQGKEKREERINKENLKTSPLSPSFPRFVKIIKSYHSTRCLVRKPHLVTSEIFFLLLAELFFGA